MVLFRWARIFLYRDMKCGRIFPSHGGQLPVLHKRKWSQHFMNQAKFHSTFPILLLLKSLHSISLEHAGFISLINYL